MDLPDRDELGVAEDTTGCEGVFPTMGPEMVATCLVGDTVQVGDEVLSSIRFSSGSTDGPGCRRRRGWTAPRTLRRERPGPGGNELDAGPATFGLQVHWCPSDADPSF